MSSGSRRKKNVPGPPGDWKSKRGQANNSPKDVHVLPLEPLNPPPDKRDFAAVIKSRVLR